MRKHTVTHDDNGWTHEKIAEDGKFERSGIGIGTNESKVGVGYRKEWFWGTRTYRSHTRVLNKKESIVAIAVFGLLSILIFTLEDSYLPMFVRQFLEVGSSFALMVSNFLELPSFSVILR